MSQRARPSITTFHSSKLPASRSSWKLTCLLSSLASLGIYSCNVEYHGSVERTHRRKNIYLSISGFRIFKDLRAFSPQLEFFIRLSKELSLHQTLHSTSEMESLDLWTLRALARRLQLTLTTKYLFAICILTSLLCRQRGFSVFFASVTLA